MSAIDRSSGFSDENQKYYFNLQIFYLEFLFQEGADLRHLLSKVKAHKNKRLNEHVLRGYFRTIAEGVRDLQSRGFIYRDLKPDNILISGEGDLLLTDFEFSIHMHLDPNDIALFFLAWTAQRFEWDFRFIKKQLSGMSVNWFDGENLLSEHFKVNLITWQNDTVSQLLEFFNSEERVASLEEQPVENASREMSFRRMQNVKSSCNDPLHAASHRRGNSGTDDPSMQKIVFKETHITGSLEYLSPEVLERNLYSVSSDVWALGCLVYDLFYRRALFLSERKWKSSEQKKLFYIDFINEFDPHECKTGRMSPDAADLFQKLLVYNPYDRLGVRDFNEVLEHPWLKVFYENPHVPYLPVNKHLISTEAPNAFFIYNIFYEFNHEYQDFHLQTELEQGRRKLKKKANLHIQTVPSWNRLSELESRTTLDKTNPMTPLSIRLRTGKQKQLQLSLVESKESFRVKLKSNFTSNDFKKTNQSFWKRQRKPNEPKQKTFHKLPARKIRINPRNHSRTKRTSLHFKSNQQVFSPTHFANQPRHLKSNFQIGGPKKAKKKKQRLRLIKNKARYNSNDAGVGKRSANFTLRKLRMNSNEVKGNSSEANFELQAKPTKRNFFKPSSHKGGFKFKFKESKLPSLLSLEKFWRDGAANPEYRKYKADHLKTSIFNKNIALNTSAHSKMKRSNVGAKMYQTMGNKKNLTLQTKVGPRTAKTKRAKQANANGVKKSKKKGKTDGSKFQSLRQKFLGERKEKRSLSKKARIGEFGNFMIGSKLKLRSSIRKKRGLNSLGDKSFKF